MAYPVPTASALKARYPAFADVADATVNTYLGDASTTAADDSWQEADYPLAVIAFAAHRMALLGIGNHGQVASYARQGVTSLRTGGFAVSLDAEKAKAVAAGSFDATPYGQEYKRLLGANKGGPRVIGASIGWGGDGPHRRQNNGVIIP